MHHSPGTLCVLQKEHPCSTNQEGSAGRKSSTQIVGINIIVFWIEARLNPILYYDSRDNLWLHCSRLSSSPLACNPQRSQVAPEKGIRSSPHAIGPDPRSSVVLLRTSCLPQVTPCHGTMSIQALASRQVTRTTSWKTRKTLSLPFLTSNPPVPLVVSRPACFAILTRTAVV